MISFVYFDLGGVVNKDFSGTDKWEKLKEELGITPEKVEEFEKIWNQYEGEVCVGKYDVDSLIPIFNEKFHLKIPESYPLLIDGFVNRFEVNKSIWSIIDGIHKKCRVGLLTNMYPRMLDAIRVKGLMPETSWDVIIDSSVVGLQKPYPEIFRLAEEKAGVKGSEILFVENSKGHVKAAQNLGWQTFLYDPKNPKDSSQELLEFFKSKT